MSWCGDVSEERGIDDGAERLDGDPSSDRPSLAPEAVPASEVEATSDVGRTSDAGPLASPSEPPPPTDEAPDESHEASPDDSIAQAMEMGSKTVSALRDVGVSAANVVGSSVKQGLDTAKLGIERANERIEAENRRWEERKAKTKLPRIGPVDPLADLALRLDRQGDFFRELAVDALRPTVVRRLVIGLVIVLATTTAGLALAALWHAFFEGGLMEGLLELVGALVLAATATATAGVAYEHRRASIARDSLTRADRAEGELRRVAELLALAKRDRTAIIDVLKQRATMAPPRDDAER